MKRENLGFIDQIINVFSLIGKSVGIKQLSPEQIALLTADEALVRGRAKAIADAYNKREYEWEEKHNNTCPNCGAKKDEIVNKIREVHGSGRVNHCNKCGNEWKKFKRDFKSSSEPPRDGVKYIARIIRDPVEYKWAHNYLEIFDGCYVETILKFAEDCTYDIMDDDREVLCSSKLNKYFKSVWDDPNVPKNLLKLL
jgi:hypothetical protein